MAKAKAVKLLSFTVSNTVGKLAEVTALLAEADISMQAIRATESGSDAQVTLVVKNAEKAKKALAPLVADIREAEGLCLDVPNKAGRLQKAAKKIAAAGVNIRAVWGTAFTGGSSSCVLETSDDKKALAALKK